MFKCLCGVNHEGIQQKSSQDLTKLFIGNAAYHYELKLTVGGGNNTFTVHHGIEFVMCVFVFVFASRLLVTLPLLKHI